MTRAALLLDQADRLSRRLAKLRFGPPVSHVYDPLQYARAAHAEYLARYADGPKDVLFVGMNPGPFGMTQTGVPFGEVAAVRDWLGVKAEVGRPKREHPKRKVEGFACARSEVSGARFWGLWRALYGTPERFFAFAFVANYCPLVFMEESGRNVTPDKLAPRERAPLLAACDAALGAVIEAFAPRFLVGVGRFAEARAKAVAGDAARVLVMPHPSPASPGANRNWAESAEAALHAQGLTLRGR
jgi:single-strand selective monofunctional uracil DNA glycosylase